MRMIISRRRERTEEGFTLVEVVLTVAILSIISVALIGIVFQYLKTNGVSGAKLRESTDQQFISAYWQADVSSLGRRTLTGSDATNPAPSQQSVYVGTPGPLNCGASTGSVVVAFAWNEFPVAATVAASAWTPKAQEAAYVSSTVDGQTVLKRVRCREGEADESQTVARTIVPGSIVVACADDTLTSVDCGATSLPNRVTMTFTSKDLSQPRSAGYTTRVTADRRQG